MAAVWKCIVEAQISLWTFLLGCRAPFELSHNFTDLVHTCSLLELWVGGTSGSSSMQTLHSFILKTTEVNMALSTGFTSLRPDPHSFILKDIRTALSIFRQVLSHQPTAARPGEWPAQPVFSTSPQGRYYSLHSLCSFSSHWHRKIRHKVAMKSLRLEIWRRLFLSLPFPKLTFTQTLHYPRNFPLFNTQLPTSALPWDINRQEPQLIRTQPLSQSAPQEVKC